MSRLHESFASGRIKHAQVMFTHPIFANLTSTTECLGWMQTLWTPLIPGTCVQHPGLQGGSALGDASKPGTPAGSMAASTPLCTYSHVAVAGRAWGREMGAVAATAAAAARRRVATPTGRTVTPPRSASARDGRGGRHGARVGGWN